MFASSTDNVAITVTFYDTDKIANPEAKQIEQSPDFKDCVRLVATQLLGRLDDPAGYADFFAQFDKVNLDDEEAHKLLSARIARFGKPDMLEVACMDRCYCRVTPTGWVKEFGFKMKFHQVLWSAKQMLEIYRSLTGKAVTPIAEEEILAHFVPRCVVLNRMKPGA